MPRSGGHPRPDGRLRRGEGGGGRPNEAEPEGRSERERGVGDASEASESAPAHPTHELTTMVGAAALARASSP